MTKPGHELDAIVGRGPFRDARPGQERFVKTRIAYLGDTDEERERDAAVVRARLEQAHIDGDLGEVPEALARGER